MNRTILIAAACLLVALAPGCRRQQDGGAALSVRASGQPAFSLAWSEYPSWSVFGVAEELGLIDGAQGRLGPLEEKWGVDIVLQLADYDTCIQLYGSSTVDAVCITNMDILAPALSRDSVAVLPTSTSAGADACIVVGIDSLEQLRGRTTYGLEKSVSQYCFERNLVLAGLDPAEFPFVNRDPGAAAQAMQAGQREVQSIVVWNPFVLQTLRTRDDAKVLFDSSTIPEEIIDMVVVGRDALDREGGEAFVGALMEAFYEVNRRMEDPEQGDATLVAIGAKFSDLSLEDMKEVVQQTQFYSTPEAALELFERGRFRDQTTPLVVEFCVEHDIVEEAPSVGFDDQGAQLNFDGSFLRKLLAGEP